MSKAKIGAEVAYCGHDGWFVADIYLIEGANVVRATGPVTPEKLNRPAAEATHHLSDHLGGFWRPDLGVFVVPQEAVQELDPAHATKDRGRTRKCRMQKS